MGMQTASSTGMYSFAVFIAQGSLGEDLVDQDVSVADHHEAEGDCPHGPPSNHRGQEAHDVVVLVL